MTISIVSRIKKIKTSNYRRLISYKDRKEKEQFEFKDQQNVKDFVESEKQDEMMKEFAKENIIWIN
jgi:predicted DNA binding CopG/RHH family protein